MSDLEKPQIVPLVIGLTRPRMMWGVPLGNKPITEAGKSQLHFTLNVNY